MGGSLKSPATAVASGADVIVVDVVGKVRHPGVYRLPGGSRVDDAITAAGGPARGMDLSAVNLARKLADGEQLAVGVPRADVAPVPGAGGGGAGFGPGTGAGSGSGAGGVGSGALLNLNTATLDQLDALPGVGPVLAQRILDWRAEHGGFRSVDDLNSVSGIGDASFAKLRPLVTV